MKCEATTKNGQPCSNTATQSTQPPLCSVHTGDAHAPTKLTPETQDRVVQILASGAYKTTAAEAAGVHATTLHSWLERGEAPDAPEPYRSFYDAVKKAEAEGEARLVALIAQAGRTQWQANAWLLERKHPDRWGRRYRLPAPGEQRTLGDMTLADLAAAADGDDD